MTINKEKLLARLGEGLSNADYEIEHTCYKGSGSPGSFSIESALDLVKVLAAKEFIEDLIAGVESGEFDDKESPR